jgi:uncharacterized membrane protein
MAGTMHDGSTTVPGPAPDHAGPQAAPGPHGEGVPPVRSPLVDAVTHIEDNDGLDAPAEAIERLASAVVRPGPVESVLTGRWLGHAVHPLMTDLPIGFWTSSFVLDLVGGRASRKAADRLLLLGILSAVPTAATGLAEFLGTDQRSRRVGVVHANANTVGLALYVASYVARKRGRRARGVALALGGSALATVGGFLGGHLAIGRKAGTTEVSHDTGPAVVAPPTG